MSHPLFDLSGQKALITGGGRGIGLTLATGLAQAGADVALADIDFSQVEEGQREIEALGRKCTLIEADVTDVAGLIDWLKGRGEGYGEAFADLDLVRVAVNQSHVDLDHALAASDEVAFFPPVTGG